jgi:hypothetical protein
MEADVASPLEATSGIRKRVRSAERTTAIRRGWARCWSAAHRLARAVGALTWRCECGVVTYGPATTTPIPAGKSLRSGAAAATATWNGAAIAAQPFTRRSRDRTADSATEAPSPCSKTSNAGPGTHREPILRNPRLTVLVLPVREKTGASSGSGL